jgi:tellurite resistance protein
MTTATQKLQILESLNALDQSQSEKVLAYIKDMLVSSRDERQYKKFKREAMKEIRQALKTDRSLKWGK